MINKKIEESLNKSFQENDDIINEYTLGFFRCFLKSNMHQFIDKFIKVNDRETCIFDKKKILKQITLACDILYKAAENNENILFFGSNFFYTEIIEKYAKISKVFYISRKAFGGFFTNKTETLKNIEIFESLHEYFKVCNSHTKVKKRKVNMWKKLNLVYRKMMNYYIGLFNMKKIPDIVVFLGYRRVKNFIIECFNLDKIKIINITDVNAFFSKKYNSNIIIPIGLNFLRINNKTNLLDYLLGLFSDSILLGRNNISIDPTLKTIFLK